VRKEPRIDCTGLSALISWRVLGRGAVEGRPPTDPTVVRRRHWHRALELLSFRNKLTRHPRCVQVARARTRFSPLSPGKTTWRSSHLPRNRSSPQNAAARRQFGSPSTRSSSERLQPVVLRRAKAGERSRREEKCQRGRDRALHDRRTAPETPPIPRLCPGTRCIGLATHQCEYIAPPRYTETTLIHTGEFHRTFTGGQAESITLGRTAEAATRVTAAHGAGDTTPIATTSPDKAMAMPSRAVKARAPSTFERASDVRSLSAPAARDSIESDEPGQPRATESTNHVNSTGKSPRGTRTASTQKPAYKNGIRPATDREESAERPAAATLRQHRDRHRFVVATMSERSDGYNDEQNAPMGRNRYATR